MESVIQLMINKILSIISKLLINNKKILYSKSHFYNTSFKNQISMIKAIKKNLINKIIINNHIDFIIYLFYFLLLQT